MRRLFRASREMAATLTISPHRNSQGVIIEIERRRSRDNRVAPDIGVLQVIGHSRGDRRAGFEACRHDLVWPAKATLIKKSRDGAALMWDSNRCRR